MKSFGKTFRTFLAMSLVLCMVMSCVAVSADGTVTLTQIGNVAAEPDGNGYYQVQYEVSGISEGGSATILVYEKDKEVNNDTIEYANQKIVTVAEGDTIPKASFTMLLDNGIYTVAAGGTGFATANFGTTLAIGSAPTISAEPVAGVKDNQTGVVVANITVVDADATDTDDNIASVAITAGDENKYFDIIDDTIVTTENVPANTYNLTLTVTDDEGKTGTCTVAITIVPSTITLTAVSPAEKTVDYGTTAKAVIDGLGSTLATNEDGVNVTVEWVADANYGDGKKEGTYTFVGTLTAPEGNYALSATTVNASVKVEDKRTVVTLSEVPDQTIVYGETAKEVNLTDYTDVADASITAWSVTEDGNVTTYTATITLPELTHKFSDGTTSKEVSYTVTYNETRKTITSITLNKTEIEIGYKGTPNFSDIVATADTGDVLAFVNETWTGSIDATVNGATAEYTNSVVVPEDTYIYTGSKEVKVTVKVVDKRPVISAITCDNADIEVAYNATLTDIEAKLPKAAFVGCDEEVKLSWTNDCPTPLVPGNYTFTAEVVNEDTDSYNFEVTEKVSVKVTVASYYRVDIADTYELGEDANFSAQYGSRAYAVAAVGEGVELNITGGNYDGGTTPAGGKGNIAVVADNGAVINISGGKFRVGGLPAGTEGHIDLIYAIRGGVINISGGEFDATGRYVWGVNVYDGDAQNATGTINITGGIFKGWNPANPGFKSLDANGEEQIGKVETYLAEGYTTKLVDGTVDTWEVVQKTAVNTIDPIVVYLIDGESRSYDAIMDEKTADGTITSTIAVGEIADAITNIEWPTEDEALELGYYEGYWPPSSDEPLTIPAKEGYSVHSDLKLDAGVTPSIKFVTVPSEFEVAVNGVSGSKVVTKVGEDVAIDLVMSYDNKGYNVDVAYEYAVTDASVAPTDTDWKAVSGNIADLKNEIPNVDKAAKRVTVRATVAGYALGEKRVYVYRQTYTVDGAIYISSEGLWPTDADVTYSSLRVSKNRNMQVKFDLVDANGQALNLEGASYEVKLDDTVVDATIENGIITINKSYLASYSSGAGCTVSFTCKDANGKVLFARSRKTHVTDANTLWYNKFSVDGADRGGIRVRRDAGINYVLDLDGTAPDGTVYTGLKFVKYANKNIENGAETLALSDAKIEGNFSLVDFADNGSYVLYGLANLGAAKQDFYDFKFGRTVYLYNTYTNVCNLYLNGSTYQAPSATDGKLSIVPHLGGALIDANHTYYYTMTLTNAYTGEVVNVNPENVSGAKSVVGNVITSNDLTTPIVISNATKDVLTKGIRAEINVYVDDNATPDKTISRVFYTYNITNEVAE